MAHVDAQDAAEAAIARASAIAKKVTASTEADQLKQLNSEASRALKDAEQVVRQLETDARAAAPSSRRAIQDIVGRLKSDLQRVRADLQKANDVASRAGLLSSSAKSKRIEAETRDKLVVATETSAS